MCPRGKIKFPRYYLEEGRTILRLLQMNEEEVVSLASLVILQGRVTVSGVHNRLVSAAGCTRAETKTSQSTSGRHTGASWRSVHLQLGDLTPGMYNCRLCLTCKGKGSSGGGRIEKILILIYA